MMKVFGIASGVALSLVLSPLAQAVDEGSGSTPRAAQMRNPDGKKEYPEMRRALHALENAKKDLKKAAHHFGGHREKALELTDQAIHEVKQGMEFREQAVDAGSGNTPPAAQMRKPVRKPDAKKEYPEMTSALHALENAKKNLENAAHDFGGHREKALELTDQAIHEVKQGMEFREEGNKEK